MVQSILDCGRQSDTISPSRSKRYFDNNVQLDYHWSVQVLRYKHEEFSIMYFPTANLRYLNVSRLLTMIENCFNIIKIVYINSSQDVGTDIRRKSTWE